DQNNLWLRNLVRVANSLFRESRGCNKHPFCGTLTYQAAGKGLYCRSTDHTTPIPSLCLDINGIKSQLVLFNNPVNPIITRLADNVARILDRSSITECQKQVHY